jgi:outer membrane receptor protein involved in Fe transport
MKTRCSFSLLLATALVSTAAASPACAQAAINLNLPAQELSKSLKDVARATGTNVVFDPADVKGKKAPPLVGQFTPEAAIAQLIANQRLVARSTGSGTWVVSAEGNAAGGGEGAATLPANPPAELARAAAESNREIVVTGTNIRGTSPTSPVIRISRRDIELSGRSSVADVIRTLPQNFNGGQNVGNDGSAGGAANQDLTGASSPNLRGLGTSSTLTLVDGRRLAFNGYQGGSDISIIPLAAVESVEVLTDGASAIYGSDAVAGVVNIKLRTDYDGFEGHARISATSDGGAFQQQYDLIGGQRWATGNAVLSYEHADMDPLDRSQRDFASSVSPNPYYLLPAQRRNSLFGSVRQDMGSGISLFADGLFTRRVNDFVSSTASYIAPSRFRLRQFGGNAGADFDIAGRWHGNVTGTVAGDRATQAISETILSSGAQIDFPPSTYRNRVTGIEASANGPLLRLPAGLVKLALGAGYRRTQFDYLSTSAPASGARSDRFLYGEMLVPLVADDPERSGLTHLELSLAGRYDHFSDFGTAANPKIGLAYKPLRDVTLTATWSRSFRAPELYYSYGAPQRYLFSLATPRNGKSTYIVLYGSNPDLGAERSTAWNTSIEYRPASAPRALFRVSAYAINYRNRVAFPFSPYTVGVNNPGLYAPYFAYDPSVNQQTAAIGGLRLQNYSNGAYDPASVAFILDSRYRNLGRVWARGIDASFRYGWLTDNGSVDLNGSASYIVEKQKISPQFPIIQTSNRIFNPPSFRGRLGADWTAGAMTAAVFLNYTGPYKNNISAQQQRVGSRTTIDARVAWAPEMHGFASGLSVAVSSQNLLNARPPSIAADSFNFLSGLGYDSTNASALGRVLSVELVKRW